MDEAILLVRIQRALAHIRINQCQILDALSTILPPITAMESRKHSDEEMVRIRQEIERDRQDDADAA